MDVQEMISLIKAVSEYGMTEFKLDNGSVKLSLKKDWKTSVEDDCATRPQVVLPQAEGAGVLAPAGVTGTPISSDRVVTSPLVGTFYCSPSPEAESFVKVGDRVKKGQVLGIIEAMKLMNEIESEYDGVVEAVLVENEEVVEYGQPLFRIC